ncbi:MAG: hypothetical protein U0871_23000 [Gemmataceae bacterium]
MPFQHPPDRLFQPGQAVGHPGGGGRQAGHLPVLLLQHPDEVFQHLLGRRLVQQKRQPGLGGGEQLPGLFPGLNGGDDR